MGEKALVVKIGGSLLTRVPDLIPVLKASRRTLFIVPGGGIFADAVRRIKVDDDAAHWMAIAAMEQYGWLLSSQGLTVTAQLKIPSCTTVFLPYTCLKESDPLPHTWDITSDSIAAWVAGALHVDLLLLKSTDGITGEDGLQEQVSESMKTDVVDPFFISYVLENKIHSTIINGSDPERVRDFLKGVPVPGTIIGTTF
ncbi:uridylate kinase [Methanoregula sp.]|uniref:uridylate kinase n=1 Tax=Methanoregula sp. TaxID=2052170 RepID=UPI003563DDF0